MSYMLLAPKVGTNKTDDEYQVVAFTDWLRVTHGYQQAIPVVSTHATEREAIAERDRLNDEEAKAQDMEARGELMPLAAD